MEEGSYFYLRIFEFLKRRGGGRNWRNGFGELSQGTIVARNFVLGG
jgi:hypothetical protein